MLALPSEKAAEIALRTQQVLMEETGVANVADPLGGSWYVEALTDKIEAEAEEIFARIRAMGSDGTMTSGILRGIEDGWFMAETADSAFITRRSSRRATRRWSASTFTPTPSPPSWRFCGCPTRSSSTRSRCSRPARPGRDAAAVSASLTRLTEASRGEENLVPLILDACRLEATLGEVCGAMGEVFGPYREPARF